MLEDGDSDAEPRKTKRHEIMKFTKADTTFETDLKYYRELFRLREIAQREKYDFFWGPFADNKLLAKRINFNRMQRRRRKMKRMNDRLARGLTPGKSAKNDNDSDVSRSESDEQDVNGVVRGNPYDLEDFYMRFSRDL